jgi:hypothetical protein
VSSGELITLYSAIYDTAKACYLALNPNIIQDQDQNQAANFFATQHANRVGTEYNISNIYNELPYDESTKQALMTFIRNYDLSGYDTDEQDQIEEIRDLMSGSNSGSCSVDNVSTEQN